MEENGNEKRSVLNSPKEETPIRAIVCLKRKEDIERFEETEECFILDFDPSESLDLSKISLDDNNNTAAASDSHGDADADISFIAEKGPVACRDYPHSRHLCIKFPFKTTPHESHCEMCYCYVCDSTAPCKYWSQASHPHCDAYSGDHWKKLRTIQKLITAAEAH